MTFISEEWTFIRQSLDEINIKGKDAKGLASLQIKVEQELQKAITKSEKDLEKAMKSSK
tara:strand:+ start:988 stop:1164 length:177 start_codon:yes stop_codon:yes gene_type:complete